jgi:hypothetical protein
VEYQHAEPRDAVARVPPPKLSIVIASVLGQQSLVDCVNSFVCQADADTIEVIVATSASDQGIEAVERLAESFPCVRVLRVATRASIPELRAIGFLSARGDILAMTEDHCVADVEWVAHVIHAHESEHVAIGGAVENGATTRTIDWAVYFCEYGRYMLPIAAGSTDDLPGPNVSYKRRAFEQFQDLLSPATWDPVWHWRLRERGMSLIADPTLVVYHCKHFTFGGFVRERYHYSRSFAGRRVAGVPFRRRAAFLVGSPLLPPVVLARVTRRVWAKGRCRSEFLRALPFIAVFSLVWAVGEFIGYACGEGQSAMAID